MVISLDDYVSSGGFIFRTQEEYGPSYPEDFMRILPTATFLHEAL